MRFDNYKESNWKKLVKIIKINGPIHLIKRIYYRLILRPLILMKKEKQFQIRGCYFNYFFHTLNSAFISERTVEIPLFRNIAQQNQTKRILEIGNVLAHYSPITWEVVDKYEDWPGINNVDIVDFFPAEKYDVVISISTFEHIGFDEDVKDPAKILLVIDHLVNNCLNPQGVILFSLPIGWNPGTDKMIRDGTLPLDDALYLVRTGWNNNWKETEDKNMVFHKKYSMHANAVIAGMICKDKKSTARIEDYIQKHNYQEQ